MIAPSLAGVEGAGQLAQPITAQTALPSTNESAVFSVPRDLD